MMNSYSNVAVESLPDINACGTSIFDPIWSRRFHQSNFTELLCLASGRMTLIFKDERCVMKQGDFAFVPPGVLHVDKFDPSDEPEIFVVRFRWAAVDVFFQDVSNSKLILLRDSDRSEVSRGILKLRDLSLSEYHLSYILMRSMLHSLLLNIWCAVVNKDEFCANETKDRKHDLMLRARNYLDAHYHESVSLEQIAKRLNVSVYYLSRVFSHESGFSMKDYLTSVRMRHAHDMLSSGACNVSETAYGVGYESGAYFSRVFKQHFGIAPSEVVLRPPPSHA